MDERKAYWFEQPYMPQMKKNIAVAPRYSGRWKTVLLVFQGMMVLRGSGVWNLTGKRLFLDGG